MDNLTTLRAAAPAYYPDNALYARYTAERNNLLFQDHDEGTGFVYSISSREKSIFFGGGKCPAYPQNNSTNAYLATDKYFANRILSKSGIPNLGGQYFFLHDRFKLLRKPGLEISDALRYVESLGGRCFVKPLSGSRGDFAQAIDGIRSFQRYIVEVQRYYDAIIVQPVKKGREYRIFVQDGDVVYSTRKIVPQLCGDGTSKVSELLARMNDELSGIGISIAAESLVLPSEVTPNSVLANGQIMPLPGRANRSAGGNMVLDDPPDRDAAFSLAVRAANALGLSAAGVDIFANEKNGNTEFSVIEINSSPSIRFLEEIGRSDLIERIWLGTFASMGLIDDTTSKIR